MRTKVTIDVPRLVELFHAGATWQRIAEEFGLKPSTARCLGQRYNLRRRRSRAEMRASAEKRRDECSVQELAPTPEDAVASEDSLRLSPWVLRRIDELGIHGSPVETIPRWQPQVFVP